MPTLRAPVAGSREHHGQRDVAAAVARPAFQDRQAGEGRVVGHDHLLARSGAHPLGPGLGQVEEVAELAQLLEHRAGHAQLEELGHPRAEVVQALGT